MLEDDGWGVLKRGCLFVEYSGYLDERGGEGGLEVYDFVKKESD